MDAELANTVAPIITMDPIIFSRGWFVIPDSRFVIPGSWFVIPTVPRCPGPSFPGHRNSHPN
jgi:hypothetical protein